NEMPGTEGSIGEDAVWGQTWYNEKFQEGSTFEGYEIDDIAQAVRNGCKDPEEVPIDYIERDGHQIILNTRSATALERAGIPREYWYGRDRTLDPWYEDALDNQLAKNNLTNSGIPVTVTKAQYAILKQFIAGGFILGF